MVIAEARSFLLKFKLYRQLYIFFFLQIAASVFPANVLGGNYLFVRYSFVCLNGIIISRFFLLD